MLEGTKRRSAAAMHVLDKQSASSRANQKRKHGIIFGVIYSSLSELSCWLILLNFFFYSLGSLFFSILIIFSHLSYFFILLKSLEILAMNRQNNFTILIIHVDKKVFVQFFFVLFLPTYSFDFYIPKKQTFQCRCRVWIECFKFWF